MSTHDKLPHGDVDHPEHYNRHPSGVECITIAEGFNFNLGNAIKYIWRAGLKGDAITDLLFAEYYIGREISRLSAERIADDAVQLVRIDGEGDSK